MWGAGEREAGGWEPGSSARAGGGRIIMTIAATIAVKSVSQLVFAGLNLRLQTRLAICGIRPCGHSSELVFGRAVMVN